MNDRNNLTINDNNYNDSGAGEFVQLSIFDGRNNAMNLTIPWVERLSNRLLQYHKC